MSYKIKFIDSARFMVASLSNFTDNLVERIHKIKSKDCNCFLEYKSVKLNSVKHKYTSCNKSYSNIIDEEFKKWFKNTFHFSSKDINKFILLLRKGVYSYEYMDEWERFKKTLLPQNQELYSNLNIEGITDANYVHSNIVCKNFEINNWGEYHDLYLKNDALLLADDFKNQKKEISLKTWRLDPAKCLSDTGLAQQTAFKKTKVKLLIDINMLVMVEKGIRVGTCDAIHRYGKTGKKYMIDYDKNKEP